MSDNPNKPTIFFLNPEGYSPSTRRTQIASTVMKFISRGISKTAALQAYRDAGIGITRSDFNDIYDQISKREYLAGQVQALNDTDIPQKSDLAPSPTKLTSKYRFVGLVTYYDSLAQEQQQEFFSVDTSKLSTVSDLTALIKEHYQNYYQDDTREVEDVLLVRGYYKE